ncbi:hypothetical protein BSK59_13355 [Paenibacillus odorifer]|uniref:hypothetical protein n=1 Tax=Paenibacillus odorifer TaxID=189426 RepID=UPI00096DFBE4|nr:hypothetical protein [Paenibacillus odorifer]OME55459.1 hypothetical protein BSK59_13355 [Paenibacillus odorifer]
MKIDFNYGYNKYLTAKEMALLDQAEMTANLLNEVADLRRENEEYRLKELKQSKMMQEQYDTTNNFLSGILVGMIDNVENKKL